MEQTYLQAGRGFTAPVPDFPASAGAPPHTVSDFQQAPGEASHFDSRFRFFVGQLDLMVEALHRHPGANLGKELDALLRGMWHHFGVENDSMRLVGYPGMVRHTLHQQSICLSTAKLCYSFHSERPVLPADLAAIRQLWLEHIQVHDRAWEDFLAPRR
jgi:hemerythrin